MLNVDNYGYYIWAAHSGRVAVGIQQQDSALEERQGVRQLAARQLVGMMSLMHFCRMPLYTQVSAQVT